MSESRTSTERQPKILLLRSPTETGEDKYENVFKESEYEAINVPVLETVNVNIEEVKNLMGEGPQDVEVDGVIMTSGRSSSIWKDLAQELSSSEDVNSRVETSGKTIHPRNECIYRVQKQDRGEICYFTSSVPQLPHLLRPFPPPIHILLTHPLHPTYAEKTLARAKS
jgi:hypothetical protein